MLVVALAISNAAKPKPAMADCMFPADGRIVTITVESCQVIGGRTNAEVLKFSGAGTKIYGNPKAIHRSAGHDRTRHKVDVPLHGGKYSPKVPQVLASEEARAPYVL